MQHDLPVAGQVAGGRGIARRTQHLPFALQPRDLGPLADAPVYQLVSHFAQDIAPVMAKGVVTGLSASEAQPAPRKSESTPAAASAAMSKVSGISWRSSFRVPRVVWQRARRDGLGLLPAASCKYV